MFSFGHPMDIISAVEKYCTSFHGATIWDLGSVGAQSIVSAWKVNVKMAWNVKRECRNYIVDTVLVPHCPPLMSSLLSRFHTFFLSLLDSGSLEVRVISRLAARDLRSNLGSNLCLLKEKSGLDPWTTSKMTMKKCLRQSCVTVTPESEKWRLPFLEKLLNARLSSYYSCDDEVKKQLSEFIDSLVKN